MPNYEDNLPTINLYTYNHKCILLSNPRLEAVANHEKFYELKAMCGNH